MRETTQEERPWDYEIDIGWARKLIRDAEQAEARNRELEAALRAVLPMAKGYAHEHPVGANQIREICDDAIRVLAATPPPDSEPAEGEGEDMPECQRCGERKTIYRAVVCPKCDVTFHDSRPPSDATPPQRRGALEAFKRIYARSLHYPDSARDRDAVRHALTADVPENIRALPFALRGIEPEIGNQSQRDGWLEGVSFAADELERACAEGAERRALSAGVPEAINVVFDGPPGPTAGRFVEVETDDGKSVRVGEWIERLNGFWALRIDRALMQSLQGQVKCSRCGEICESEPDGCRDPACPMIPWENANA